MSNNKEIEKLGEPFRRMQSCLKDAFCEEGGQMPLEKLEALYEEIKRERSQLETGLSHFIGTLFWMIHDKRKAQGGKGITRGSKRD